MKTNDEKALFYRLLNERIPVRRHASRIAVVAAGSSLSVLGIVMIVTPGPALVVLPCGLYLLAREFLWARRLYVRLIDALPARLQKRFSEFAPWEQDQLLQGNVPEKLEPTYEEKP